MRAQVWLGAALLAAGCGGGQTEIVVTDPEPSTGGVVVEEPGAAPQPTLIVRAPRPPEVDSCPEPGTSTFVLHYNARLGTLGADNQTASPVGGQRVVVCVEEADWRDAYTVTTAETGEQAREGAASEIFTVGSTDIIESSSETVSTRGNRGPGQSEGQICGADTIAAAAVFLETHRSNFMRRLVTTLSGQVSAEEVDELRYALDNYRYPRQPASAPSLCPPNAVEGGQRCSLESFVNFALLPRWLWLADGEWLYNEAAFEAGHCAPRTPLPQPGAQPTEDEDETPAAQPPTPPGFVRDIPPNLRPAVIALARSLERVAGVADLAETLLSNLEQPETVFDLGSFNGNNLAIITVARHRRTLILRQGTARMEWRTRRTLRRQEVHALSTFRLEPGFAFSLLRRPTFGTEITANGDQIIALDDEGLRLVEPAVFVSFYWCGQDLRVNPWDRSCHGHEGDPGWWLLAHLPSIAVGIPINADLFSERASFFLGLLLDWIPYVSIGVGAHIGLAVPALREGVLLGDPLAGRQLEDLIEERPQVSGYVSLSMSIDAFQQLAGFTVSR
jgi:hypothetical protein